MDQICKILVHYTNELIKEILIRGTGTMLNLTGRSD